MQIDLTDVESELRRIPEVRAARIVADANGVPIEVHVLAAPGKSPKQVVRDIQSVAMASVGLDVDHRIVSVVQLEEPTATPSLAADPDVELDGHRVLVDSVVAVRRGYGCAVEVQLRRGDEVSTGGAEGSSATSAINRLVAEATLDALRRFEPLAARACVETATLTRLGDRVVALTSLVLLVPPNEEVVIGAAPVRGAGEHEALARSVLDATNRRLHQLR